MTVLTVPATDFARGLSDFLNQVQYRGQVLDISRGKKVIARVMPVDYPDGFPIAQLDSFLATLPHMGKDEAEAFETDLRDIRREENAATRDPWAEEA